MIVNKAYTKPRPTIHRYKGSQEKVNKTTHEPALKSSDDITDSYSDLPVCLHDITKAINLFYKSHNRITENVLHDLKVKEAFKQAASTIKVLENIQSNEKSSGNEEAMIKDDCRLTELSDELHRLKQILIDKDLMIKELETEKERLESSLIQWPENFQPPDKPQNETTQHEKQRKSFTGTSCDQEQRRSNIHDDGNCISRTTKQLAEMFADLYDNEWRKAYTSIVKTSTEERTAIDRLLNIFKECYKCCWSLSSDYLDRIHGLLQIPPNLFTDVHSEEAEINEYVFNTSPGDVQMIKSIRNMIGKIVVNKLILRFQEERSDYYKGVDDVNIKQYVSKCMELCWLTCVHDTSLTFKTEFAPGRKIDKRMAISYTKKGETVNYVVWPAFLCEEDGQVLAIAIIQTS